MSNREDVATTLGSVFGFNGPAYSSPEFENLQVPGEDVIALNWDLDEDPMNSFTLFASPNRSTGKLEQLYFDFAIAYSHEFQPDIRPQRAIRELGAPSYWFAAVQGNVPASTIDIASFMIYANGISFLHYAISLPIESTATQNGVQVALAHFCLGEYGPGLVTIVEPLTDGLENLSPVQEEVYARVEHLAPLSEVMGVDLQALTSRVMREENTCIQVQATMD